jgi:peptide-methionine (S)-S-oxide reductase
MREGLNRLRRYSLILDSYLGLFMRIKHFVLGAVAAALFNAQAAPVDEEAPAKLPLPTATQQIATFAGGCFWCMESPFDHLDGVLATTSGYTGGDRKDPTYEQVSHEETGHAESVQVLFDPAKVSYEQLLDVFWHNVDPTALDFQFCDAGHQYRSAIFYHDAAQKTAAIASKAALEKSKPFAGGIVTEITAANTFYPAENYHQDYYLKNPVRYKFYRYNCGRDQRLTELWGAKQ